VKYVVAKSVGMAKRSRSNINWATICRSKDALRAWSVSLMRLLAALGIKGSAIALEGLVEGGGLPRISEEKRGRRYWRHSMAGFKVSALDVAGARMVSARGAGTAGVQQHHADKRARRKRVLPCFAIAVSLSLVISRGGIFPRKNAPRRLAHASLGVRLLFSLFVSSEIAPLGSPSHSFLTHRFPPPSPRAPHTNKREPTPEATPDLANPKKQKLHPEGSMMYSPTVSRWREWLRTIPPLSSPQRDSNVDPTSLFDLRR